MATVASGDPIIITRKWRGPIGEAAVYAAKALDADGVANNYWLLGWVGFQPAPAASRRVRGLGRSPKVCPRPTVVSHVSR